MQDINSRISNAIKKITDNELEYKITDKLKSGIRELLSTFPPSMKLLIEEFNRTDENKTFLNEVFIPSLLEKNINEMSTLDKVKDLMERRNSNCISFDFFEAIFLENEILPSDQFIESLFNLENNKCKTSFEGKDIDYIKKGFIKEGNYTFFTKVWIMQLLNERNLRYPDSTSNKFTKLVMVKVHSDKTTKEMKESLGNAPTLLQEWNNYSSETKFKTVAYHLTEWNRALLLDNNNKIIEFARSQKFEELKKNLGGTDIVSTHEEKQEILKEATEYAMNKFNRVDTDRKILSMVENLAHFHTIVEQYAETEKNHLLAQYIDLCTSVSKNIITKYTEAENKNINRLFSIENLFSTENWPDIPLDEISSDLENTLQNLRNDILKISNDSKTFEQIRFWESIIRLEFQFYAKRVEISQESTTELRLGDFIEQTVRALYLYLQLPHGYDYDFVKDPIIPLDFSFIAKAQQNTTPQIDKFQQYYSMVTGSRLFFSRGWAYLLPGIATLVALHTLCSSAAIITSVTLSLYLFNCLLRQYLSDFTPPFLADIPDIIIVCVLYLIGFHTIASIYLNFIFLVSFLQFFAQKDNLIDLGDLVTFKILTDNIQNDIELLNFLPSDKSCDSAHGSDEKEQFNSFLLSGVFDPEKTPEESVERSNNSLWSFFSSTNKGNTTSDSAADKHRIPNTI